MQSKLIEEQGLTFDDVLMLPGYSTFAREDVNLQTKICEKLTLELPIMSSPMDTVTEEKMAIEIGQYGGLGVIHRNLNIDVQAQMVKSVKAQGLIAAAAVGAGADLDERMQKLVEAGLDVVVVDSGHGHSSYIIEAIAFIHKNYPQLCLIGGNVATYDGARALIQAGVDVLRVGMGPGSICTTRIVSGMGVPQLTAISEAVRAATNTGVGVVADGGIKQTGDMAKAIGMGASCVMLGSMLAGYDESPGEQIIIDEQVYKQYRGMGSVGAMKKGSAERYGQSTAVDGKKLIAEGVEGAVPYKGEVGNFLHQIRGSLKTAYYYIGAKTTEEFKQMAKFVKITPASMAESHPHSISITYTGENYNLVKK